MGVVVLPVGLIGIFFYYIESGKTLVSYKLLTAKYTIDRDHVNFAKGSNSQQSIEISTAVSKDLRDIVPIPRSRLKS